MSKSYYSLGLMSGTSMDGVDASIIHSDGKLKYKAILDKYFEYPKSIYNNLTTLRDKIKSSKDLKKHQKQIKSIEKEITIFHAKAVNEILKKTKANIDFIGFHGQTIFHNPDLKISKQLGDGKLLSKLTKKKVVYDFRQNDLKNGGEGAPLTPIFHNLLAKKYKIELPLTFLNIGGISNVTVIKNGRDDDLYARDIGPGNCMIDDWIRKNKKGNYDKNGSIARKGKVNKSMLEVFFGNILHAGYGLLARGFSSSKKILKGRSFVAKTQDRSFDIKTWVNLNPFFKHLSLEDGAATITELTARYIAEELRITNVEKLLYPDMTGWQVVLCGGGRKNNFLVDRIKSYNKNKNVYLIDDCGVDGDFIESQAFAYLAIRSYLGLPISFPNTTGCKKPCTGGVVVKNY